MSFSSSILGLFGSSSSDTNSNLFSALYSNSGSVTTSASNALRALSNAEQDQTKEVAATAKQTQVARDVATFRSVVGSAKTVAQVLDNPTALKVLLTANGLGSYSSYAALAKKALTSDPSKTTSLANTLSNQEWAKATKYYNFYSNGLSVLQKSTSIDAVANGYAEVVWRQSLDATTPGLSNALSFRSEASTITSANQILGDSVMRTVVTTALGIPAQIAYQPLEAQQKAITNRLDIKKLQDPKFVESFVQKYLIAATEAAASTSTTSSVISLAEQSASLVV